MRVYLQLQKELENKGLSKNAVIRMTGIDRSTFYQIIHGKRMATSDQLIRIMDSIGVDSRGRFDLLSEYEKEKADEKAYQSRTDVRNFINQLAKGPDLSREKLCPEKIRSVIHSAGTNEDGKLQIYLPGTLMIRAGIYAGILCEAKKNRLEVEYLSAFSEEDETGVIFGDLAECLHGLEESNLAIRLYHLDGVRIPSIGVLFPYYILTKDHLLLVSSDAGEIMELTDPEQKEAYRSFFEEQIEKAKPLMAFNRDESALFERMRRDYTKALRKGQKVYFITPQPCIMLTVTQKQLQQYPEGEKLAAYWHLINSVGAHEFTSPSGITRFMEGKRIKESGVNIPLREKDMVLLRKDLESRIGKNLFLLNDNNIHLSGYWEMVLFEKEKAVFAPFDQGSFLVSVTYPRIVDALVEWCESRMQGVNADVVRNSRA